mgnify:CR=1 FL=1
MPYGLKYQTQFTSQSDANNPEQDYTLQFLYKDYTGEVATLTGGATTCLQKCTVDEPNAAIKGQSLDITLVNEGNIPISSFFSEDDDGIQVKLLDSSGNIKFIGFLVQDDFYEGMVDYGHDINLSANDGLGLLKGVILSEADVRRSFYAVRRTNGVDTVVYNYVASDAFYPQPGDPIEYLGVVYTIATAVFETTVISGIGYNWTITLTTSTGGIAYGDEYIFLTGEVNLLQRNSILSIVALCLGETNLPLILNVFHNLYEYRQDNTRWTGEQTLIDTQLFISGETFMNCYESLTKILETFRLTLFQANGQWNIISWDEMHRSTGNAIRGFVYNETFTAIGTTTFTNNFNIGPEPSLTQPIYELVQGGLRGYKFTRKQFDYNQPKYLLRNYDLQTLGNLRSTYVSSGITYSEYDAPGWTAAFGTPAATRFIRVAVDSVGTEIERYLVVTGPAFDGSRAVQSDPIELSAGDKVKFSFSCRTNNSGTGGYVWVFAVRLYDGTLNYYVDDLPADNGDWISGLGFSYVISGGDNTQNWHSVEIQSSQAPISGILFCYLAEVPPASAIPGNETHYKDIRLEITQFINDTSKAIGHIHKQDQPVNKKNNTDVLLSIDDSPRSTIKGTLFLDTKTGLLQDRTFAWRYPPDGNGWPIGEWSTLEELTWRQKTRSKLEGGFTGLYQNGLPASLLTMVQTTFNPTKNYTFGLLTVDYKRNQFSGSLWEMYDENDGIFDPDYTFKYIYSTT